ncbi:hypothetical protein COOONC_26710 [Cooperia oncophora]
MSGGDSSIFMTVSTTLSDILETLGLEDQPRSIPIYTLFVLMKISLIIMIIWWNRHDVSESRSTILMVFDEEIPLISDLPMVSTPARSKPDEKAK